MLAVTPVVNMYTATHNIFIAEKALWKKNIPHGKAWRIVCDFDDLNDASTRGTITGCTFRVYLRTNYTKRVLVLTLKAETVVRARRGLDKRGSGIVFYSANRSIKVTKINNP